MARVVFNALVDSVHGKLCNEERAPIFAQRKDTGAKYVYHVDRPYTGPLSDAQEAQQARFKQAATETKNIMNSLELVAPYKESFLKQKKYGTLRGYIFAQAMKNA